MNNLTKFWLSFLFLSLTISCDNIEPPLEGDISSNEVVIEGDGGISGIEVLSNNGFVIFNTNSFSILDQAGEVKRQIPATNHVFANIAVDEDQIFLTGRSNNQNTLGLSAYDLSGDKLWEKFITHDEGEVESPNVEVIEGELILAFISSPIDNLGIVQKTINIDVFTKNGTILGNSQIEFEADVDFFTHNLLIENKDDFLVQGSRTISDSEVIEPSIQVYRFIGRELAWYKVAGPQGFATVRTVVKSPAGGYLFVGSKQIAAWAFEFDANGNMLWDIDHGDGTNKYWFYDALYMDNSIHFCGYTNASPNQLEMGLLYTTGLNGSNGFEKIFGSGENLYRHNAMVSRSSDELVFGGNKSFLQGNRIDSWILFTDTSGN